MAEFTDVYIEKIEVPDEDVVLFVKENCDVEDVFDNDVISEYVKEHFYPAEIFDTTVLEEWAEENGYVLKEK